MSMPMVLNLGLSGQPFAGPDIGGFAGAGDGALFARWMGVGALLPFARGPHREGQRSTRSRGRSGPQVEAHLPAARSRRRYRLLPVPLHRVPRGRARPGLPVARPAVLRRPAGRSCAARRATTQFLLGADLLVDAPDGRQAAAPTPRAARGRSWHGRLATDRRRGRARRRRCRRCYLRDGAIVPLGRRSMQYSGEKPLGRARRCWSRPTRTANAAGFALRGRRRRLRLPRRRFPPAGIQARRQGLPRCGHPRGRAAAAHRPGQCRLAEGRSVTYRLRRTGR